MNRHREHVAAAVEDVLGSVAVMYINVENGDPVELLTQPLGRDRAVVEKTRSAGHVGEGMMAGRPTQPVGESIAVGHGLGR